MFNEFKLNDKVPLRNKVVLAPMTTWLSNDDLTVSDEEALHGVGYDLIALGHVMITEPEWVERVKAGEGVRVAIDMGDLEAQQIPEKLAKIIQGFPGWFEFKS